MKNIKATLLKSVCHRPGCDLGLDAALMHSDASPRVTWFRASAWKDLCASEAVPTIRPGRLWPTQTRSWPTQTARVIPMIPTYTNSVCLPKICLAFDWPTQIKFPRTAAGAHHTL